MRKEFERRFLMTQEEVTLLFNKKLPLAVYQILQGYLWTDEPDKEFRIRLQAKDEPMSKVISYLAIKELPKNSFDHNGSDREEVEFRIDFNDAIYNLKNNCTKFLKKKRYILEWKKDFVFEINVINERLIILEIEFPSEEDMKKYVPDFEYSMEVTNDRTYYSYYLASEYSKEETLDMLSNYVKKMM